MISKFRHKMFVGVLLLAVLLAASGSMILYQFLVLNKSISALIENNYKTIKACQAMLEALEREDSGVLLLSLGEWQNGRGILNQADSAFQVSFRIAEENLTEANEDEYIADVRKTYRAFKSIWERPIVGTEKEGNIQWYTDESHTNFLKAKEAVSSLMILNQGSMYGEALIIKERSYRAIMPGIVAVAAVILFAFLFNFFLSSSLVDPVQKLIRSTKNFRPNHQNFSANLKNNDEFKELENGIQDVIEKLKQFYEKQGK